ncbi:MAG: M28 family peptidase [Saprospiraceae bacterium]|nr:M28 family peptidase [Saprospiraceae bacterium]
MELIKKISLLFIISFLIFSCKSDSISVSDKTEATPVTKRKVPKFNVENAYSSIEKQVGFGPRYPGTKAHKELIEHLTQELEKHTDHVIQQDFKASFLGEKNVDATNIIGVINPDKSKRILLCAHFDTRKIAEKDKDEAMQDKPILGADDGASGVAVLLEIAKLIKENGIDVGVDFVLFDAEDNGESNTGIGWCLGAKHWSKNPHVKNYKAEFGILLDMVGAKNAEFGREGYSQQVASKYIDYIWDMAGKMSYGNYFLDMNSGTVEDDHRYVIENLRIPMVDIINMSRINGREGFGHYHHTHDDNLNIIDKNTLKAVGKVVTAVVYNFSNGKI